jgi:hypothetical protein
MKQLHDSTLAFLTEAHVPTVLGHDDANLFETAPEARAFFEEFFQTVGAIQRLGAEVQEKARQLASAEKQFDAIRDRATDGLGAAGFELPAVTSTP